VLNFPDQIIFSWFTSSNFIFWENQSGLRKDIKAWFLMRKITVIVDYKGFNLILQ
jgi:hypothetical protein